MRGLAKAAVEGMTVTEAMALRGLNKWAFRGSRHRPRLRRATLGCPPGRAAPPKARRPLHEFSDDSDGPVAAYRSCV